jgi:hypothetical protein
VIAPAAPTLTRIALAAGLLLALFIGTPSAQAQTTPRGCESGQGPTFTAQFAPLLEWIAPAMGTPFTCAYADPAGTGDLHILTNKGLVYWRQSTGTLSYTLNDDQGQQHWALIDGKMLGWLGDSIDPPTDAVDLTPCRASFKDVFEKDFNNTLPYVWSGRVKWLGEFDGQLVVGCEAWQQRYVNTISCFLRAGQAITAPGSPTPCNGYGSLYRDDDGTVVTNTRSGYVVAYRDRARWVGNGFEMIESIRTCWGEFHPIPDDMPFEQISAYCGYKG